MQGMRGSCWGCREGVWGAAKQDQPGWLGAALSTARLVCPTRYSSLNLSR